MNIRDLHMEVACERFLEIMASKPATDPQTAAVVAVDHADKFTATYAQYARVPGDNDGAMAAKTKGCRKCHGSGGKASAPCEACGGTGKVPA